VSTPGPSILVVDDVEDNRYTLTSRLRRDGYHNVVVAENGRQALEKLANGRFDLVLLDIRMPEMDGYEVLAQVKAHRSLREIPVIMISADDEFDSVIRCIELGAEDHLGKPFNPILLRARVRACLEKKRLRDEALEHMRRVDAELTAARELQLGMVPTTFPEPSTLRPFEIFARLEPAREVGGDLYDFFYHDDALSFFLGDVSDKGVPAALFMARAKNVIGLMANLTHRSEQGRAAPDEILCRANRELALGNKARMFVTLFFGIVEASGELRFCNAGHNAPYVLARDGLVPLRKPRGVPLGIKPDAPYVSGLGVIEPGEMLFLFSDGITEATNANGAFFSHERLETTLRRIGRAVGPRELIDGVLSEVREFTGSDVQSDDIAALAIARTC
jgi:sigma-B regulation protein RsbU (phosphoserine phosphatase)